METQMLVWRVVGWDRRFETRGTLRKRGPRAEIVVSTDLHGGVQQKLLDASGGFIAFALWNLICRIAATSSRRGVLLQDGRPLNDADLSRLARFPLNLIQPALRLLESPEIGLLERVSMNQALIPAEIPAPLPRKPRIKPLLECPVCAADLTEYYQLQAAPPPQVSVPVVSPTKPPATEPTSAPRRTDNPVRHSVSSKLTTTEPAAAPATEPATTAKPRSTWRPVSEVFLATPEEIREVARRFENGEMTEAEVYEFLDTHYYDDTANAVKKGSGTDGQKGPRGASHNRHPPPFQQEEDDDEEDWDEDLRQDFQSGIPPPKQGKCR